MTKQELARDMKQTFKSSFANITQLSKYLNRSREYTMSLVCGLQYSPKGVQRMYFVNDVAQKIIDESRA